MHPSYGSCVAWGGMAIPSGKDLESRFVRAHVEQRTFGSLSRYLVLNSVVKLNDCFH